MLNIATLSWFVKYIIAIPFARCVDVVSHPIISRIQDAKFQRLPASFIDSSQQIHSLTTNDIIISKVGTPCYASLITEYDRIALSRTVLGLKNVREMHPAYLVTFLRSKYGFSQLMRERELTIQYQLTLDRIRRIRVFRAGEDLQKMIVTIAENYSKAFRSSMHALTSAEDTLTAALGLADWSPPEPLAYTASSPGIFASGRLDAQYYMPAKDQVLRKLAEGPGSQLGDRFASIKDLFDPKSDSAPRLVRNYDVTDALEPLLDDEKSPQPVEEIGSTKKNFQDGDVAISRLRAYLREIAVVRTSGDLPSVGSSEYIVLRAKAKREAIAPETLMIFLRSQPVQTVLKWCQDGSQHPRFSESDLLAIPLPDAVSHSSPRIEKLVRKALDARSRAKDLLERAKQAVEMAVEDSEKAALRLLRDAAAGDA